MRSPILLTFTALTLLSPAARAANNCRESGWVTNAATFDGALEHFNCSDVSTTAIDGAQLHIVQDMAHLEPAATDIAALIASAAKAAFDKYQALNPALAYHDVTVILTPTPRADGVQAAAHPDLHNECLLEVFTGQPDVTDATRRAALLPNTIAHELFHCVQYWTVPAQAKVDKRAWWLEGSAEAMAQTVFDSKENYETLNDQFSAQQKPLTQLEYPAYVFFAWLLQARGPASIFTFISAMPAVNGEAAQRQALLATVTGDDLNRFAEAWVDGAIQTPQGWSLGAPSAVDRTQTFTASGEKSWPDDSPVATAAGPFTVQWGEARFSHGRYELSLGDSLSPQARFRTEAGVWAAPPEKAGAPCGRAPVLRFAGFNTRETNAKLTLNAHLDPSTVGALPEHDSCLNGSWVLDSTGVENAVNAAQPTANPKPVVNGDIALLLPSGGGGMTYRFDDYDLFLGFDSPASVNIELGIKGSFQGSWSNDASHRLRLCPDTDDVQATTTVQVFSAAGTTTDVKTLSGDGLQDSTYTCTATTLTLTGATPSQQAPNATVYKRPGAPDSKPTPTPPSSTTTSSSTTRSKGCSSAPGGLWAFAALLGLRRRVRRS